MNSVTHIFASLRRKIAYAATDIYGIAGLHDRVFREARGARIVLYHGICKKQHTRFSNIFLCAQTFEEHLQFYKKYFHVVSLDDFYAQRFSDDRFNICIAFDDGYANNYDYVLPLLKEYEVPAAFFITGIREAGYDILWNDFLFMIGKYGPVAIRYKTELFRKEPFNRYVSMENGTSLTVMLRKKGFAAKSDMMEALYNYGPFRERKEVQEYWMQLTEAQIKELAASPLVTIGSHGYYHNDLSKISLPEAEAEITQSKRWLEKITGKQIQAIAFPYGAYSQAVLLLAKEAGFSKLLAVDFLFPEDNADHTMQERFTVNPFISVHNQMLSIIKGKYAY